MCVTAPSQSPLSFRHLSFVLSRLVPPTAEAKTTECSTFVCLQSWQKCFLDVRTVDRCPAACDPLWVQRSDTVHQAIQAWPQEHQTYLTVTEQHTTVTKILLLSIVWPQTSSYSYTHNEDISGQKSPLNGEEKQAWTDRKWHDTVKTFFFLYKNRHLLNIILYIL